MKKTDIQRAIDANPQQVFIVKGWAIKHAIIDRLVVLEKHGKTTTYAQARSVTNSGMTTDSDTHFGRERLVALPSVESATDWHDLESFGAAMRAEFLRNRARHREMLDQLRAAEAASRDLEQTLHDFDLRSARVETRAARVVLNLHPDDVVTLLEILESVR